MPPKRNNRRTHMTEEEIDTLMNLPLPCFRSDGVLAVQAKKKAQAREEADRGEGNSLRQRSGCQRSSDPPGEPEGRAVCRGLRIAGQIGGGQRNEGVYTLDREMEGDQPPLFYSPFL